MMDVTSGSSDGVRYHDALLVDDGAVVAMYNDACFEDI
jgi:hypothetical protein